MSTFGSKEQGKCFKEEGREFIRDCIKLYRNLPVLWMTKSADYMNRKKRAAAYEILLCKYRERYPEAERVDVKKKFNSLRTNFRKELKKISDSKKSDKVYQSTLWYFGEMEFLMDQECPSNSANIKNDSVEPYDLSIQKEACTLQPSKAELNENQLTCKRSRALRDEFDQLARTWTIELQNMTRGQQLFAKKAINDILFEGQMGTLHRHSVVINGPSTSRRSSACSDKFQCKTEIS